MCQQQEPRTISVDEIPVDPSTSLAGDVESADVPGGIRSITSALASQHYAKRTNYTFRAVKTTALIDYSTGAILDIHCSMKQPHDSQVAWQLLARNLDKLSVLTADKSYDWELLRHKLRAEGVKQVVKYREFGWHGVANNVLLDETTCHQRSNIESTFFALRRKYDEIVRTRTWFGQFRELVLKCATRNVELALNASNGRI